MVVLLLVNCSYYSVYSCKLRVNLFNFSYKHKASWVLGLYKDLTFTPGMANLIVKK